MDKQVTIIIPAYNAEKTIERALDSCIDQNYANLQILVINDGSTDKTEELLQKYKGKLEIITKPNGGVSEARNIGIQKARGDYITFLDSDDNIEQNYITELVTELESKKADIVISGYIRKQEEKEEKCAIKESKLVVLENNPEWEKEIYYMFFGSYASSICSKLYKKELLQTLSLKKIKIGEDMLLNMDYIRKCKTVFLSSYAGYYYTYNLNSATNNKITNILEDLNEIIKDKKEDFLLFMYAYRIYGEYVFNCANYDKKENLYHNLKKIESFPQLYDILTTKKYKTNLRETVNASKRSYLMVVNTLLRQKHFRLLTMIEKIKIILKRL